MKVKRKIVSSIILGTIASLVSVSICLAAYSASLIVQNTSGTDYDMLAMTQLTNIEYMASEGIFDNAQGLDTRVKQGTTAQKHLLATDRINFATGINDGTSKTLSFTTEDSNLSNFPIICGHSDNTSAGYVLTSDNASLEISDNGSINVNGIYLNDYTTTVFEKGGSALICSYNATAETVTSTAMSTAYAKPTGHSDPDTQWTDEANAYNDSTANYAYDVLIDPGDGKYLVLTTASINVTDVRFYINREGADVTAIQVDIYNSANTSWVTLHDGAPDTWGGWNTFDVPGDYILTTQMRILGTSAAGASQQFRVYDSDFNQASFTSVTATGVEQGEHDINLGKNDTFTSLEINAGSSPVTPVSDNLVVNLPFWQDDYNTGANVTSIDSNALEFKPNGNVYWSDSGFVFDGTNDYLTTPYSDSANITSAITLEGWFKLNTTNAGEYAIIGNYYSFAYQFEVRIIGAGDVRLSFLGKTGGVYQQVYGNTFTPDTEWHHGAVTWDGTTMRFYLDGSPNGTPAKNAGSIGTTNAGLYIGVNLALGADMNGYIGETRVYDSDLSASEVLRNYNATKSKYTTGDVFTVSALTDIPDTANDWYFYIPTYADNISISVGGTRQLYYCPNEIIESAVGGATGTLPDRENSFDGTIYWGDNPTGIALDFGVLESDYEMYLYDETQPQDIMPEIPGKETLADAARRAALEDHFAFDFAEAVETITGGRFTVVFQFQMGLMTIALALFFLGYFFLGENLAIAGTLSCIPIGYGIAIHAYDWWVIAALVLWLAGCVIAENRRIPA